MVKSMSESMSTRAGDALGLSFRDVRIAGWFRHPETSARSTSIRHPCKICRPGLARLRAELQQIADPVYLSQISSVAATIVGSSVAALALSERLPDGFALAALPIVLGLALFQYRRTKVPRLKWLIVDPIQADRQTRSKNPFRRRTAMPMTRISLKTGKSPNTIAP